MKKRYPISMILFIMVFLTTPLLVSAQNEKSEEEVRKEMMEQEMQNRKKMLEEQQEQMKQWEVQFKEQQKDLEERAREAARVRVRGSGTYVLPDGEFFVAAPSRGSQSQLTLRKNFEGTTNVSKGTFEVDENIRQFRCMINGSVDSGEIYIGIEYPDGNTFKELVINSSADINLSQSVSVKEGEEKKYVGSWSYVIKTNKAEGHYMLQISTN
ncbi:MAG: hypothetical protein ACWGNV_06315 [Bacteroidales bacterium]